MSPSTSRSKLPISEEAAVKIPFALAVLVLAAQGFACAAPVNPPVIEEPQWPSRTVERLARRACFDCHSN